MEDITCAIDTMTKKDSKKIISYETVLWTIHTIVTALAIIDRFTTNVWPRQSFSIGSGSAGNDRLVGFKPGPWSVVLYDVIARVSGRFSICVFNFMLISRLELLEQWLASSWLAKNWIDCSNIVETNLRAHKWNGIALCVLTVLHVWSILFPHFIHNWSVQVVPGVFEWPLSERTPAGFKDMDPSTDTISMQVDDVFRMVEMTLLLCVLVPLSVKWMSTNWHLGIHAHRFITVVYFVDIVRRHSHPHSWVLNTPVFCIWILDKILCMSWRKVRTEVLTTRETISRDYIVLYWAESNDKNSTLNVGVASKYFMKLNTSGPFESRHPFTSFKADDGVFQDMHGNATNDDVSTRGAVVRVFNNTRKPKFFGDQRSHTQKLVTEDLKNLDIWGPYQSRQSALISKDLLAAKTEGKTIIFVGSGSAINFMIDAFSFAIKNSDHVEKKRIVLLHSTRDEGLHMWVTNVFKNMLSDLNQDEGSKGALQTNTKIILSCTANGKELTQVTDRNPQVLDGSVKDADYANKSTDGTSGTITGRSNALYGDCDQTIVAVKGRIDLARVISNGSLVFCQGSEGFVQHVNEQCKLKKNVGFHFD